MGGDFNFFNFKLSGGQFPLPILRLEVKSRHVDHGFLLIIRVFFLVSFSPTWAV